jgi:heme oxygenase (biliverdin-IX-beta and delta-forming)
MAGAPPPARSPGNESARRAFETGESFRSTGAARMSPAHRRLRDATAEAHRRVDTLFDNLDLRRRGNHRMMLAAHGEALIAIETALDMGGAVRCAPAPPVLRSNAAIAGTRYVLEGSRMGDRYLGTPQPRSMWLTLLERIDGLSGNEAAMKAAMAAALDAFARFEQAGARWLAKVV